MMATTTTRYLLTCAAIGAAGAVVLVPANNLAVAFGTTVPFAYAALVGLWLLPSVFALALLRRPGSGVLAATMAGAVVMPLNPTGPTALLTSIAVGVAFELPFAIGRYRTWSAWLFQASALLTAALFLPTVWVFYDLGSWTPLGATALLALVLVSCNSLTAIGCRLATRVESTGVVRGLARSSTRRPPVPPTLE